MKKLLILTLLLPSLGFSAASISASDAYEINRSSRLFRAKAVGTKLYDAQQRGVKATWDYSVSGGAASSDITLLDHEGNRVTLPAKAVVTNCIIDVVTMPTAGAVSSARIAFSSSSVGDLKASSLVHTTYTTGSRVACIPDGTVANTFKMGSEATLKIRTGSEALTGGKLNVWVEYVISD